MTICTLPSSKKIILFLSAIFIIFTIKTSLLQAINRDASMCKQVRFSDVGWTDISVTTALASEILAKIGYNPSITILSTSVTFASIKNNDIDVFLGNWIPAQDFIIEKYLASGSVKRLQLNLIGGKYTLAVPKYVYDAGVRDFADIAKYKDNFNKKIYGIEAGSSGNSHLKKIFKKNHFNLGDFELVPSSEQGMMIAVKSAIKNKQWIVFLGWAPHPMNSIMDIEYLTGGDEYFGANYGGSQVYTVVRRNFARDCPNLKQFFTNLVFDIDMENYLMKLILEDGYTPKQAAKKWIDENPAKVKSWLLGVDTYDGEKATLSMVLDQGSNDNFSILKTKMPIGQAAGYTINLLTNKFSTQFRMFSTGTTLVLDKIISAILSLNALFIIFVVSLLSYWFNRSKSLSLMIILGLLTVVNLGYWEETINTAILVILSTLISVFIGLPVGILSAKKQSVYLAIRPILDLMQTIPTFVYLIPTLMLFGLGVVPGIISTVVFAIAAPIRLTYLGIKSVPNELKEAGIAFGANWLQLLLKVELPHALSNIRAGITQCIMLSLSMVVVAALVGADGLGQPVIRALNTVNIEQGFEAGLSIVILAIILDRLFKQRDNKGLNHGNIAV